MTLAKRLSFRPRIPTLADFCQLWPLTPCQFTILRTFTIFNKLRIEFVRDDWLRELMKPETEESSNIMNIVGVTELVAFS